MTCWWPVQVVEEASCHVLLMPLLCFSQHGHHLIIPRKGLVHIWPANRFMKPMRAHAWEEKKTNKHKEIRRDTPASGPQLSRGRVPFLSWNVLFVLQTFCAIYVELHINQVRTSRMSRDSPPNRPQTLPRHTGHQIPLCVLCLSSLSSP